MLSTCSVSLSNIRYCNASSIIPQNLFLRPVIPGADLHKFRFVIDDVSSVIKFKSKDKKSVIR